MKRSQILNIMAAIAVLLLLINWVFKSTETGCFNWFDYASGFMTLFINMSINIFAAVEG